MAIIRNPTDLDNPINYVATVAFFCCASCVVLMLKFRGFRASLTIGSRKKKDSEVAPTISVTGAYRVYRDEFEGNGRIYDPPKKLTPSMVKLPPSFGPEPGLRPAKSTSDLVREPNIPPQLQMHRSTHDISQDPRGGTSRNQNNDRSAPPVAPERKKKDARDQEKEQKKLEKQRLAEEKAREKAAAQEQARQEKLRRESERQAAQEQAKLMKKNKRKQAAPPQPQMNSPLAQNTAPPPPAPPAPPPAPAYSTNTLDSSISRSSGPPPYSETSNIEAAPAGNSNPGNVSFSKPIDNTPDSWDLISQHRQQMSRPVASSVPKGPRKNMVMDLQYKLGTADDKNNSNA